MFWKTLTRVLETTEPTLLDVVEHPGDRLSRLGGDEVLEGLRREVGVDGDPEIEHHPLADQRRQIALEDPEQAGNQGPGNHAARQVEHQGRVLRRGSPDQPAP